HSPLTAALNTCSVSFLNLPPVDKKSAEGTEMLRSLFFNVIWRSLASSEANPNGNPGPERRLSDLISIFENSSSESPGFIELTCRDAFLIFSLFVFQLTGLSFLCAFSFFSPITRAMKGSRILRESNRITLKSVECRFQPVSIRGISRSISPSEDLKEISFTELDPSLVKCKLPALRLKAPVSAKNFWI